MQSVLKSPLWASLAVKPSRQQIRVFRCRKLLAQRRQQCPSNPFRAFASATMSSPASQMADILTRELPKSGPGGAKSPEANKEEALMKPGEDAMDALSKLSPKLAAELNKGYKVPDLIRLIRTKHPESGELVKLLIMLQIADQRLMHDIDKADGISVLAEVLQRDSEDIKLDAIRLLGGMATDGTLRNRIAETDVVQRAVKQLMTATSDESILTLLMAIRNFAGNSRAAHEICDVPGVYRRIFEFLNPKRFNEAVNENAAGLIANLARDTDHKLAIARAGTVLSLGYLLESTYLETVRVTLHALVNLSHTDKVQISRFEEAGLIPRLVRLLKQIGDLQIQELSATLLEYLALKFKNRVLIRDAGGIPALIETLKSRMHLPNKLPFLEAIRNVCDESDVNKVAIREAGGVEVLVGILKDRPSNTQKENEAALGAIHNLASESRNRSLMHKLGVLTALFDCLDDVQEHPVLVYIAVRTLHRLCVDEGIQYDMAKRSRLDTLVELIQSGTSAEKLKEVSAATILALIQGKYHDDVRELLKEGPALNVFMMVIGNSDNAALKDLANSIMFSLNPRNSGERKA